MATSESLTRLHVAYPIGDASQPPRPGIEARQRAGFAPSTDEPLLASHPELRECPYPPGGTIMGAINEKHKSGPLPPNPQQDRVKPVKP